MLEQEILGFKCSKRGKMDQRKQRVHQKRKKIRVTKGKGINVPGKKEDQGKE
jgi:hypothetical protein